MPHVSYALFKAIRNHRVDIPVVMPSAGRPNACNLCHLDQTLSWAAGALTNWYGQPPVPLNEVEKTTAASLLWLIQGDAMQRVLTAWSMSWKPAMRASGSEWQAPFLARTLSDPYSAVRFVAWRSLKHMPEYGNFAFDFLDLEGLEESVGRALGTWKSGVRSLDTDRASRLLLHSDGRVNEEKAAAILKDRDDRLIEIFE
ncbi:MAG: hypothetical protein GY758_09705 [Fuerstiella sp.]|nr:hypothetical protein [Fuerstiella sp.]